MHTTLTDSCVEMSKRSRGVPEPSASYRRSASASLSLWSSRSWRATKVCFKPLVEALLGSSLSPTGTDRLAAWAAYWLPVLQALTAQCTNPCREVRQLAFSSLQRQLLSPDLDCEPNHWTAIFGKVLFPLIHRLLKPEIFSADRDGMSEMRVQASSLLCKVFLQYMVLLSEREGMLDLWVKIIEIMDRLMNSGQGDSLVSSSLL